MKKIRAFEIILDDGNDVYKIHVPAYTRAEAVAFCDGNGDVVRVKDITDETPLSIYSVCRALKMHGFGECENDLVWRIIQNYYANTLY